MLQVLREVSAAAFGARPVFEPLIRQFERVQASELAGTVMTAELAELDVATYQAQQVISQQGLWAINHAFSVGGATAVTEPLGLDRYWRNARVLAQHNPVIYRNRIIGDYVVNGTARVGADDPGELVDPAGPCRGGADVHRGRDQTLSFRVPVYRVVGRLCSVRPKRDG